MGYSNLEMAIMHFMYGKANGNSAEARRLYQESFPGRNLPSAKAFRNLHLRLCKKGSFQESRQDCGRNRSTRSVENVESVLDLLHENPGTSVRRISLQEGIPKSCVWEIAKEQLLYQYHLQRVQPLKEGDFAPRLEFCTWLKNQWRRSDNFLKNILFTDEAGFTRDGVVNFHNTHEWADENPRAYFEYGHQDRFSINVWVGVIAEHLIGPWVLPNRLNGALYLQFLQTVLPELLEDLDLETRAEMYFMHDGAPPHFVVDVRAHLDRTFPGRWIGRGGPVLWPARSPDLNPLDFCIWGYLKSLVYSVPINNIEQLEQRVIAGCAEIRNKFGLFSSIRRSMKRRVNSCIEMNGRHFEHLL